MRSKVTRLRLTPLSRPRITLVVMALLAIGLGVVATRFVSPDTAPDTIVDPGSAAFRHEVEFENVFGADPVIVLLTTDVRTMFAGNGLQQLELTEANLATQDNQKAGVQSIYGPASFATITGYTGTLVVLQQAQAAGAAAHDKAVTDAKVAGKSDADAEAAGKVAQDAAITQFTSDLSQKYPQLASIGNPTATSPGFMTGLFINSDTGQPKPRFSQLVPDGRHLLVTARLRPDPPASVATIVASIRKQAQDAPIPNAGMIITGVPILQSAIGRALRLALIAGMIVGGISMVILMLAALRRRVGIGMRVVPVVAGLATVALMAGLVALVGAGVGTLRGNASFGAPGWQTFLATFTLALNPATLAAFPIALGLAVDYAVQFLYRYSQADPDDPVRALGMARVGAGRATRRAALCTAAGLLALMISSVPMVRQFGVVMIMGTGLAWVVARLAVLATIRAWPRLAQVGAATANGMGVAAEKGATGTPLIVPPPAPPGKRWALVDEVADDDVALFGFGDANAPPAPAVAVAVPVPAAPQPQPAVALAVTSAARAWTISPWDRPAILVMEAYREVTVLPPSAAPVQRVAAAAGTPAPVTAPRVQPGPALDRPAPGPTPAASISQPQWGDGDGDGDDDEDEARREPGHLPALLAGFAHRRSAAILVPALLVALAGWIAFPFSAYETDPEKLVSPSLPAFQDLNAVRQATGAAGELDFVLSGPDVTSPEAIKWVNDLQATVQRESGGKMKPLGSLAQLLSDITQGAPVDSGKTKQFLGILPPYVTNALVDPQHHLARISFGLSLGPVAEQRTVVDRVLKEVQPPTGYTFYAAGFSYLGIQGLESLQANQVILNLLGAALVLAMLFVIYRRPRLALVAWAPTLLVAGWSTAVLFALRLPLTPMTAVLGALAVAFGTEFAILWLERYREALAGGAASGAEAAEAASRAAGPGIILSGAALVLGFLALTTGVLPGVSNLGFDLPMVRDFALVAAMDMILAVVAALVVLPAIVIRVGLTEAQVGGRTARKVARAKADASA